MVLSAYLKQNGLILGATVAVLGYHIPRINLLLVDNKGIICYLFAHQDHKLSLLLRPSSFTEANYVCRPVSQRNLGMCTRYRTTRLSEPLYHYAWWVPPLCCYICSQEMTANQSYHCIYFLFFIFYFFFFFGGGGGGGMGCCGFFLILLLDHGHECSQKSHFAVN